MLDRNRKPSVRRPHGKHDAQNQKQNMPVLAKFYGIVIRMLCVRALSARFHAIYGESELVVQISPLRIVAGVAPARVCDLVLEWARAHQKELLADWERCRQAERPLPIAPLQ
jgi:hypothetical protein